MFRINLCTVYGSNEVCVHLEDTKISTFIKGTCEEDGAGKLCLFCVCLLRNFI